MFRLIVDDQCDLRLLQPYHADALFRLTDENRAYLRTWLPWLDGIRSAGDTRNFIQGTLRQFADNNGFQTGIWYGDRLAGVIGFHKIDWANRATSVGYWLGEVYQGHGLITRSTRALTTYALRDLKLNRIDLRCATGNQRSCAVARHLGFQHEGVVRQAEWLYDHFVDHHLYSMLAQDWPPAHPPET